MSEVNKKEVIPEKLSDVGALRGLMANAQRLGRDDIVLRCQVRLAQLSSERYTSELERDFWTAVAVAEELATAKNGKTTRLSRTRQKVARVGIKQCLEDWAFAKGTTQGFEILVQGGRPELTGEAIVVRHAAAFSPEAVTAARERLSACGIDPASM